MGDLCCTVGNTDILGNNCVIIWLYYVWQLERELQKLGVTHYSTPTQPHTKSPILSPAEHEAQTSQCCFVVLKCSEFHSKSSSQIPGTFVCCLFLNGFHLSLDRLFNVLYHKLGQTFLYKQPEYFKNSISRSWKCPVRIFEQLCWLKFFEYISYNNYIGWFCSKLCYF